MLAIYALADALPVTAAHWQAVGNIDGRVAANFQGAYRQRCCPRWGFPHNHPMASMCGIDNREAKEDQASRYRRGAKEGIPDSSNRALTACIISGVTSE